MTEDELRAYYTQFCRTLHNVRSESGYWERSALDDHLSQEVMRNAFFYIGSTVKSHDFVVRKDIEVIATRVENYYLNRKDEILDFLSKMIDGMENFIEHNHAKAGAYITCMAARKTQPTEKTHLKQNISDRRIQAITSSGSLPAQKQLPDYENIDLETVGVFLAAQHLKLQQMGCSSGLDVLKHIAAFVVNGGILSQHERMIHMWMAHKKLNGQENVLWEAFAHNPSFATLPVSSQFDNTSVTHILKTFESLLEYKLNMFADLDHLRTKDEDESSPTFFESKEQYMQTYSNALVMEAVHSAYKQHVIVAFPVVMVSGSNPPPQKR